MPTIKPIPRALAMTALPVALLASTFTAAPGAGAAPAAAKAAFVLNTDTGSFTTSGKSALGAGQQRGITVTKNLIGTATDTQILSGPGGRVLADTTLASSPDKAQRAAWAASDRFVDLSWPATRGATWQIYKGDQLIATTKNNSFRDTGVTPGTETGYKITGGATATDGGVWGLTTTVPADTSPATLAKTAAAIEAKARKYSKTTVVWRSFISQKWATVPKILEDASGCKYTNGYKYRGDGRGYTTKATGKGTGHRAGVRGIINWTKSKYEYFPTTGVTKVYKKNGKFVAKRKASTKKIDFRAMTRHNGKTRAVRGTLDATDPFCPKSGIRRAGIGATFDMRLARNGDFYVSGKYRQAPHHELYLYGHYGKKHTTKTVHRSKMSSLLCLSQPACERGTIGNSGGY
ncbi:hypothetical protein AS594_38840 [Streptomyces agglomeratus]|uniref:Uncharacterized protein n=1 Tax=Streptomyces agglomeratus TaxID=285458 RepID=A0A1E5NYZ7_9ACTN|nr:hypothetical protein [Streptomyces agglomeratus]OEJ21508.1 hypothetical protein AS594_38840 [Streptomyces agglomeratus]